MKNTLNHCKLQVIFKNGRKLSNMFWFENGVPYDLVPGVVYEYKCGRCNSSTAILLRDHLLECDNTLDEFTILAHRNKKYLIEIKDSLLI